LPVVWTEHHPQSTETIVAFKCLRRRLSALDSLLLSPTSSTMANTLDPHVASVLDQAGSDDEDAVSAQRDHFRGSFSREQYQSASVRFLNQGVPEPYSIILNIPFTFHYLYII
jgi:hypothetical protein